MVISRAKDNKKTTEICIEENSKIRPVYAGQPEENGGLGTDFRPSQLMLAGLVSCMSVNVRHHLDKDNIAYEDVIIKADLEYVEGGKTKIFTSVEIISDVSDEVKAKYIEKANGCYVKELLSCEKEFLPLV